MARAHSHASRAGFRPDVEGLRGLSILLVVLYHAGVPGFSGGFVGVDVFFVLSGYLITGLLAREVLETGRINFGEFYARRVRRLVPAASFVLLVTMLFAWLVYSPLEQRNITRGAVGAALYLSNIRFAARALDYHAAGAAEDPFVHTWSLSVEEQFYLVWPVFIAVLLGGWRSITMRSSARLTGTSEAIPHSLGRFTVVVSLVALASFVLSIHLTRVAQPWAFFGLPTRIWEFAIGGLAAVSPIVPRLRQGSSARWYPWIGLGSLFAAVGLYDAGTAFPGVAALAPVLGVTILLVTGEQQHAGLVSTWLRLPVMQFFGRLSYSWYLWHWPVLVVSTAAFGEFDLMSRVLLSLVALGISVLSFRWVEQPIRFHRLLVARPLMSLGGGAAAAVLVSVAGVGAYYAAQRQATGPSLKPFADAAADHVEPLNSRGCQLDILDRRPPGRCVFGDTASPTTLALFGDSHAGHWFPALHALAVERKWRLLIFVKSGCPTASLELYHAELMRTYDECTEWRSEAMDSLVSLRPSLVVMSNSSLYVRAESVDSAASRAPSESEWRDGLRKSLLHLDRAGVPTLLIHDTPTLDFSPPNCLARAVWASWQSSEGCVFTREGGIRPAVQRAEAEATAGLRLVTVADLNGAICQTSICSTVKDGMVIYRDYHHLTARFSASLATVLGEAVERALAAPNGARSSATSPQPRVTSSPARAPGSADSPSSAVGSAPGESSIAQR